MIVIHNKRIQAHLNIGKTDDLDNRFYMFRTIVLAKKIKNNLLCFEHNLRRLDNFRKLFKTLLELKYENMRKNKEKHKE